MVTALWVSRAYASRDDGPTSLIVPDGAPICRRTLHWDVTMLRTLSLALLAASPVRAQLADDARITEGLITVGIAYEISEVCPTIDARTVRGLSYLLSLRAAARRLGYSDAEIEMFMDDDAAKDRLEAVARARLAQKGAARGDVASHCRVGEAEVARDSQIGRLLSLR